MEMLRYKSDRMKSSRRKSLAYFRNILVAGDKASWDVNASPSIPPNFSVLTAVQQNFQPARGAEDPGVSSFLIRVLPLKWN